jgi:O-antigen/teichoic acid export membrane protein
VAFLIQRSPFVIEIAYGVSGVVSLLAIDWWVRRLLFARHAETDDGPIDLRVLRDQSINILIQATLFGVQVFMTNALLEDRDSSLRSAGLFNVASMVITLPSLLVALVAPVLFNRWSKNLDLGGYIHIRNNSLKLAALAQGLAIAAIPLISPLLGLVFGVQFAQARDLCLVMLFAVFAVFATRIITPALQGLGGNRTVTWSCVARLAAVGAGFVAVGLMGYSWLLAISIGWVLGEYAALLVLLFAKPPKMANQEAAGADYLALSPSVGPIN